MQVGKSAHNLKIYWNSQCFVWPVIVAAKYFLILYTHKNTEFIGVFLAVNVTLDSNVAHPRLVISRDGKQVRDGHKPENVENGDEEQNERFGICPCVLGQEGFTSDFYYEVQVKGKTEWDLGVTRESINKKEKVSLKPADGLWTIGLREGIYRACGYPYVSLSLRRKLQRVGVSVNYTEGRVSFYDVEAMCHIYTYSGQCFTENLHPFFCLGPYWRENSTVPLIICNDLKWQQKINVTLQSKFTTFKNMRYSNVQWLEVCIEVWNYVS